MFQVKYFLSYEYLTTQTQAKQSNLSYSIKDKVALSLPTLVVVVNKFWLYRGGCFVVNQKSVFLSKAQNL